LHKTMYGTYRHVYIDTGDFFKRTADLVILNRREDAFMGIANITMGDWAETFYLLFFFPV